MKVILLATSICLMTIGIATAAPLTPAQCTKAIQDCGNSIPCQEHLKKFNACVTMADCTKAMAECKGDSNCLDILQNNAGCGL